MISMFLGSVGSGKSYHALCKGIGKITGFHDRYCIANFPIDVKKDENVYPWWRIFKKLQQKYHNKKMDNDSKRWVYVENDKLTVEKLIRESIEKGFIGKEGHALLIVDEAGVFFNSRDWNIRPDERKNWIKFFSQSRKFGYDVVLVAQDDRMVDRQIRAAAEYKVFHRKANNFSFFKLLPFTMFFYVSFWNGGNFNGSLECGFLRKGIAKRYDTMSLFSVDKIIASLAIPDNSLAGGGGAGVPSPTASGCNKVVTIIKNVS